MAPGSAAKSPRLLLRPVAYESSYRPDIDGLRAVAILGVVTFHAAPNVLPGGFAGVDIFFVISGFLISGIILRELEMGRLSVTQFYARRIRRIFPSLILLLLAAFPAAWLISLPDEYELFGKHVTASSGFSLNLFLYGTSNEYFGQPTSPLLHLWSLGVEEQFYLLWPFFLVVVSRTGKWDLALFLAAMVVSFALNVGAVHRNPLASFYLPSSRLWELALGSSLAYLQLHTAKDLRTTRKSRWTDWLHSIFAVCCSLRSFLGAALIVLSFVGLRESDPFPGWLSLGPVVGTLLLIAAGPNGLINRPLLSNSAMVFIGLISYPLYLWHWPLLAFARTVEGKYNPLTVAAAAVSVSFLIAFLSYKYIELPLRASSQLLRVVSILAAAMIVCGGLGYLTAVRQIPARPVGDRVGEFLRASSEEFPPKTIREWQHMQSFIKLGRGSRQALFIGDSNIFQYYPRLAELVAAHPFSSRSVVLASRAGCALGTVEFSVYPDSMKDECRRYLRKASDYARASAVDTVVIGAAWHFYFATESDDESHGTAAPLRPETDRALSALMEAVAALVRDRKRVFIILQMPAGEDFDPRQMIRRTILSPGFDIAPSSPTRAETIDAIGPINSKLRRIATVAGATVIDPLESLCDTTHCPAVTPDGKPMYRDPDHLRPSYVRTHVRYLDHIILDEDIDTALPFPGRGS